MVTREEAEALRNSRQNWKLGIIYACRRDPRVIVRSSFSLGWTWNFGHRRVFPTILGFFLIIVSPAGWLLYRGVTDPRILVAVGVACILVLAGISHYVASGPR
jgi:uncharacterized membrane protein